MALAILWSQRGFGVEVVGKHSSEPGQQRPGLNEAVARSGRIIAFQGQEPVALGSDKVADRLRRSGRAHDLNGGSTGGHPSEQILETR